MFGINWPYNRGGSTRRDPETGEELYHCSRCKTSKRVGAFRFDPTQTGCVSSRCRDCDNQARRQRRQTRRRERFFAQFGQRYCRYCRKGKPQAAFSTERGLLPPMCDACVQCMLDATQRETQTTVESTSQTDDAQSTTQWS